MRILLKKIFEFINIDLSFFIFTVFLVAFSLITLRSIANFLFPLYFLYLILALIVFLLFINIDFEILSIFSRHFYYLSILFLILPLVFGQLTRGVIRWVPIGALTLQPSEIVRPFLLIFFANYLFEKKINFKRLFASFVYLSIPFFLIIIQPSLGVSILTLIGFIGIIITTNLEKKYYFWTLLIIFIAVPLFWSILAPYQKDRIISFINPKLDPQGAGYNSIQSMISVGSGKIFGRGLGKGVQTQLAFLPERHTDFIFASIAEELGFVGASFLLLGLSVVLWRIIKIYDIAKRRVESAYISGLFFILFFQTIIHIGMNMGLFPITGVPLPLVSAGGSSLIGTAIGLGIAMGIKKSSLSDKLLK